MTAEPRPIAWDEARAVLHERGLRWTPQRRLILDVLAATEGHVTGAEVVERCRARDPEITPSTVYRTLDVLEDCGFVHHSHGHDGREEYHMLPMDEHGHLRCGDCGAGWEIAPAEAEALVASLRAGRGFEVDLGHLTIVGRCVDCRGTAAAPAAIAG